MRAASTASALGIGGSTGSTALPSEERPVSVSKRSRIPIFVAGIIPVGSRSNPDDGPGTASPPRPVMSVLKDMLTGGGGSAVQGPMDYPGLPVSVLRNDSKNPPNQVDGDQEDGKGVWPANIGDVCLSR